MCPNPVFLAETHHLHLLAAGRRAHHLVLLQRAGFRHQDSGGHCNVRLPSSRHAALAIASLAAASLAAASLAIATVTPAALAATSAPALARAPHPAAVPASTLAACTFCAGRVSDLGLGA